MDAERGNAECEGQTLRKCGADQQRARKPGSLGVGDCVQILQFATAACEYFAGERHDTADVVARGQFRNHAAVGLVHRDLRVQCVRQEAGPVLVEREPGFVAGGFDSKEQHLVDSKGMWENDLRAV